VSVWRQLRAIALLPVMVTVVVPAFLLSRSGFELGPWPLAAVGVVLVALGPPS